MRSWEILQITTADAVVLSRSRMLAQCAQAFAVPVSRLSPRCACIAAMAALTSLFGEASMLALNARDVVAAVSGALFSTTMERGRDDACAHEINEAQKIGLPDPGAMQGEIGIGPFVAWRLRRVDDLVLAPHFLQMLRLAPLHGGTGHFNLDGE